MVHERDEWRLGWGSEVYEPEEVDQDEEDV